MASRDSHWLSLAWNSWALAAEAGMVIGLRAMKLAAGGTAAEAECTRMVSEKIEAAIALQMMAMTGALGITAPQVADRTIKHFRRKVTANRRRLAKFR